MPITKTKKAFFYGYIIVIVSFFNLAITLGGNSSLGVFFKPILDEFGWTRAVTSGAYSALALINGILAMVAGQLTDRLGPRIVVSAGGLILGLSFILTSQVQNAWQLYLFFGIMGVSLGGSATPLLSTVARWFVKRRSLMSGIVMAGVGAGMIAMPLLMEWLISGKGWRFAAMVVGLLSLVVVIAGAQFLRRDPQASGLLPDGETRLNGQATVAVEGLTLAQAIRTGRLWMLSGIYICGGFSIFTVIVHTAVYAVGLGISPVNAASIISVMGLCSIVGRIVLGIMGDKSGNFRSLIVTFLLLSAALFWLGFARDLGMLYLFAAAFGFGWGGLSVSGGPVVADLFGLRAHGALYGVTVASMTLGGAFGPTLSGYIFDVTGSYQLSFLINAIVAVIGLVLAWLLKSQPVAARETLLTENSKLKNQT
ncbi:MAG: MFS transporter [Chloroflexi bacterium]|nr:MFS transporter [Chloroflexota bacterium]